MIIYSQPNATGIKGNTFINGKAPKPAMGQWALTFWVDKPIVASDWDCSAYTGLAVPAPINQYTAGYTNAPFSSTGQMSGTTSGLFVNAADDTVGNQAICTAGVLLNNLMLFETYDTITTSYNLQVATSKSVKPGDCYVLSKFTLFDPKGNRILFEVEPYSEDVNLAKQTWAVGVEGGGGYFVRSPLLAAMPYITVNGTTEQTEPLAKPLPINYSVSRAQLALALMQLANKGYDQDPTKYRVTGFHVHVQTNGGTIGINIGETAITAN